MIDFTTRNCERILGALAGCAVGLTAVGWLLSREWEREKYPPDTPS